MPASPYMFRPAPLRRSKESNDPGRVLYSGSLVRTFQDDDARLQLYIHKDSLPPLPPDEVQWNVFSDRPNEPSANALVVELRQRPDRRIPGAGIVSTTDSAPSPAQPVAPNTPNPLERAVKSKSQRKRFEYVADKVLDYIYLHKAVLSNVDEPPPKCWLMIWW